MLDFANVYDKNMRANYNARLFYQYSHPRLPLKPHFMQ